MQSASSKCVWACMWAACTQWLFARLRSDHPPPSLKLTALYVLSQCRHGRLPAHCRQLSACVVVCGRRNGRQVDVRGQRDAAAVDLQADREPVGRQEVDLAGGFLQLSRARSSREPVGQLPSSPCILATPVQRHKARQGCEALPASQLDSHMGAQLTCSACRRPGSSGGGT